MCSRSYHVTATTYPQLIHTVTRLLPNIYYTLELQAIVQWVFFTGLLQESGFWSSTMKESNWCCDLRGRRSWPCL
jgi:hypothetical protein